MYFKKSILLICIFISSFAYSTTELFSSSVCVKNNGETMDRFLEGTLTWPEYEKVFRCIHDGLELMINYFKEEEYYEKKHLINFLNSFKEENQKTTTDAEVSFLILIKSLLVGGDIDKLEKNKIHDLYRVIYDYKDFFWNIRKVTPVFYQLLLQQDSKTQPVSQEKIDETFKKLNYALGKLSIAFQEKNFVYQILDLKKLHIYIKDSKLDTVSKEYISETMSDFIFTLTKEIFYPKKEVKNTDWDIFFKLLSNSIYQFVHYKNYLEDKDLFHSNQILHTIQNFLLFTDSLNLIKYNNQRDGFSVRALDKLFQLFMESNDVDDLKVNRLFDESKNITHISEDFSKLFIRILLCFSLNNKEDISCEMKYLSKHPNNKILSFIFPDGEVSFYDNERVWSMNENEFLVKESDLSQIRNILHYWLKSTNRINIDPHDKNFVFSHWINNDFFNEDKNSRIQFGAPQSDKIDFAHTLNRYTIFSLLFLKQYQDQNFSEFSLNEKTFLFNFKTWKELINTFSPLIISMYDSGYNLKWRKEMISLFSHGDMLFNNSNQDNHLDFKEFLDLVVHSFTAKRSSNMAFSKLKKACSVPIEISCLKENIFLEFDIFNNFYFFQFYSFQNNIKKSYQEAISNLFQDSSIENEGDLMPLFFLIQILELQMYVFDKDNSSQLDYDELLPLIELFQEQLITEIPYVMNDAQAKAFIIYSLHNYTLPLLKKENRYSKHGLGYLNWSLHPSKLKSKAASGRDQFLHMLVNIYNVSK